MKRIIVALLLAATTAAYAAGPVVVTVIVSDNDSAETNRVVKIKAAKRAELKGWMDDQQITGNLLRQTAKALSDTSREYVLQSLYTREVSRSNAAAVAGVAVGGAEDAP